jgi:peptide/nickel transport system substrate-binding protein
MKLFITLIVITVFIISCGPGPGGPRQKRENRLTFEQLDSIGRNYKPSIGKYGGTLMLSMTGDPDGFNPATSRTVYSSKIMDLFIYEGLVTIDLVTLEYKSWIAKSWDSTPDGLIWTFHMRDDVYFFDGVKVSAYDVAFTFNDVIYNEKIRSGLNYNFRIKGKKIEVTALDSFTVRFRLPAPFAPFFTIAGMSIMPRHRYLKYTKDGTLEAYLSNSADPKNVVGTGPFMLEKVELGHRIVVKRNPNYWRKDGAGNRYPYLDKVILQIIKEPNVQMLKFKNGEIDHLSLLGQHYPILKPLEKEKGFSVYRVGPSWYKAFIAFNMNNQKNPKTGKYYLEEKKQNWFRNKFFRKACAHAINYRALIDIIYNGLAYMPRGVWGKHMGYFHNPHAKLYKYDVEKAKALLEKEGFLDRDGDGILEDSGGNPVEFSISSGAGMKIVKDMLEMVKKDFENVGFKVHLNLIEFNNLMEKTTNTYDWDLISYARGGIIDPHFGKSTIISSSFRYIYNPKQKKPSYNWEARIDEIFELAAYEVEKEKRKKLYDEWQIIHADRAMKIYLPVKEVILAVNNKFGNIHLTPYLSLEQLLVWNVDEIYIK